jgi:F-type H+-transporting ATPase subunit a
VSGRQLNYRIFSFLILCLSIAYSPLVRAQEHGTHGETVHEDNAKHDDGHHEADDKAFNAGEMILEHIKDAHDWHIMDIGGHPVSVPLPVILYSSELGFDVFLSSKFEHGHAEYKGYKLEHGHITRADGVSFFDISITKNVVALFISVVLLLVIFISIANRYKKNDGKAPKGLQSFLEPLIIFVRDEIAKPNLGHHYGRYLPFLLTIFFFILINNLMGLIPFLPFGANLTGNIAVTLVLAGFTFIITLFSTNKHFWAHIFNTPGVPWWLKFPVPLMPVVELMGVITKPVVLTLRLFANITAGHIIVLAFFSLIFIFSQMNVGLGYGVSIFSIAFTIFMNFMELLVAFLQAYVFTLLSAIYFGMAAEEHH